LDKTNSNFDSVKNSGWCGYPGLPIHVVGKLELATVRKLEYEVALRKLTDDSGYMILSKKTGDAVRRQLEILKSMRPAYLPTCLGPECYSPFLFLSQAFTK